MHALTWLRPVSVALSLVVVLGAAQNEQTFTGIITDEECADGNHSRMKMGPTDADCTKACVVAHGSRYVLYDGKRTYVLSDQETPKAFAAQKVRVTGILDAKTMTIRVASIAAAQSTP